MTKKPHKIVWSEDAVPFSEQFGDHFYNQSDGRAETQHVFLAGNRLPERWGEGGEFSIAELGFGTGLNFLETWRQWTDHRRPGQHLTYTSFEGYPLTGEEIATAMGNWPDLCAFLECLLASWANLRAGSNTWELDGQTTLTVVHDEVSAGLASWTAKADAWYLDGFSPALNPDMWGAEVMQEVADHTLPGGTMASYTSAGWVRRNLAEAGFEVRKVPGYGRKREMITGTLRG